jgi:hypothetical protein
MLPGEGIAHIVTHEGTAAFMQNTLEAAALCACGVPLRTHKTPRERTGQVEWRFDYTPSHPVPLPGVAMTANRLVHDYRSGQLEKDTPAHPFLNALRALRNRERLLRWIKAGHTAQLVRHPLADVWQYESAPLVEIPSHMAATLYHTRELKLACALGVFGVPLIRVSGILPDMTFELAGTGFPGALTPPQTAQLARDFLDGTLDARDPAHPFFIAFSAIETMQKLIRHMRSEIANIWIEKPRSKGGRSAFIRADATSKARDTVFKHFRRGE